MSFLAASKAAESCVHQLAIPNTFHEGNLFAKLGSLVTRSESAPLNVLQALPIIRSVRTKNDIARRAALTPCKSAFYTSLLAVSQEPDVVIRGHR